MNTIKIFYDDAYVKEFDAKVISCEEIAGKYNIILDSTAVYAEGGGQPADFGYLNDARVTDVKEKDGVILHTADQPLAVGAVVHGIIDWKRRYDLMQHHTGEHIVSGIIKKMFGFDNVGFHMGKDFTTMDISGELTMDELHQVELLANREVYENIPTTTKTYGIEDLKAIEFRCKKTFDCDVRIVRAGNDTCACCGLHLKSTGEVGVIKFLYAQRYKGGMRIFMLCGETAFLDYFDKNKDMYEISEMLSVRPKEVVSATRQMQKEIADLKLRVSEYRIEYFKNRVVQMCSESEFVTVFEDDLSPDDVRKFCMMLGEKFSAVAVFSKTTEDVFKYAVSSKEHDVMGMGKLINQTFCGRGGGQKSLVQGNVNASLEAIESGMEELWKEIKK